LTTELENITTSFTVDWIAATFEKDRGMGFVNSVTGYGKMAGVDMRGGKGYNAGYEYENGLRVAWHTEFPAQGVHVVFSGSCLRKMYAQDIDWKMLFERIDKFGGRTSRVDLAFDVRGSGLKPEILCKPALRPYKGKGRTPRMNVLSGSDGSWTLYIGSRSSEKMLRIYDKAKEQGDYVGDYVRIELETKGEIGHAVGWNFARISKDECVGMALTLTKGVADFNLAAWDAALGGDLVDFSFPQGKQRDTFGWLVNICAPALAKEIALHPSDNVLDQFWDALRSNLSKQGIPTESDVLDAQ
jgi:hypothetical protein